MEQKIIRERDEEGDWIYKQKDGQIIAHCEDDLENIFMCGMDRFQELVNLMLETECEGTAHILRALADHLKIKFQRAYVFIEENFGEVTFDAARYDQSIIEPETILGVNFKPAGKKEVCNE